MKLLERYIFRRTVGALLLTLAALSLTVWLTQALRQFDLVTARGQTLVTFLHITSLVFPSLIMVIGPVSLLIAVIYTLNVLNADSELAVINASGASQMILFKPIILVSAATAAVVAAMALYLSPLSLKSGHDMVAEVAGDVLSSIIREGQFMPIGNGLTMQITRRNPDLTFDGIFVSDEREPDQSNVYLAQKGAIIRNPLGMFLIMQDGVIQRQAKKGKDISIIEFQSYAFDLSTFSSRGAVASYKPSERPTAYLLQPDPRDTYFQQYPQRFIAEFHDRMSQPLFVLVFGLVPLAFLGQARVTRQSRGAAITGGALAAVALRGVGIVITGVANRNPAAAPLLYVVPAAGILVSLLVIFGFVRPKTPRALASLGGRLIALAVERPRRHAALRARAGE